MKKSGIDFDIDFVVSWVDGSDLKWRETFNKYLPKDAKIKALDVNDNRYRDSGFFNYWFRTVEKFAPWVRKIHLVTADQHPDFLNLNHPKLHLVSHSDFIDEKYLPLFNSNAIEISMHKIPGLSEHFIYFNDDFFLTKPVQPEYFFSPNGNPRDFASFILVSNEPFDHILMNNEHLIEKILKKKECIRKNRSKWLNLHYGPKDLFLYFLMERKSRGTYIRFSHFPTPYKKETWETVWNLANDELERNLCRRYRSFEDLSHFVFREYNLFQGEFEVRKPCEGRKYFNISDNINEIVDAIENQKYTEIVLNDQPCPDFKERSLKIRHSFSKILPEKSSFEV